MTGKLKESKLSKRPITVRLSLFAAALSIFWAFCGAAPSRAQGAEDKAIGGPEILLSTFGVEPSVATYGRGGFVIVWSTPRPATLGFAAPCWRPEPCPQAHLSR